MSSLLDDNSVGQPPVTPGGPPGLPPLVLKHAYAIFMEPEALRRLLDGLLWLYITEYSEFTWTCFVMSESLEITPFYVRVYQAHACLVLEFQCLINGSAELITVYQNTLGALEHHTGARPPPFRRAVVCGSLCG